MNDYRSSKLTLETLEDHEQLALGGLIRVLIRLDGAFTEQEEERLDDIGEAIGGSELLWRIISRSAQEHRDDEAIRADALAVKRPAVRGFLRSVLEDVARADTIEPAEQKLLAWLDEHWE